MTNNSKKGMIKRNEILMDLSVNRPDWQLLLMLPNDNRGLSISYFTF